MVSGKSGIHSSLRYDVRIFEYPYGIIFGYLDNQAIFVRSYLTTKVSGY